LCTGYANDYMVTLLEGVLAVHIQGCLQT